MLPSQQTHAIYAQSEFNLKHTQVSLFEINNLSFKVNEIQVNLKGQWIQIVCLNGSIYTEREKERERKGEREEKRERNEIDRERGRQREREIESERERKGITFYCNADLQCVHI